MTLLNRVILECLKTNCHLWFEKWFRFLLWFMQRRIGHLSRYAMMDHYGSIMARGRGLRAYRRLLMRRAIQAGERNEGSICHRPASLAAVRWDYVVDFAKLSSAVVRLSAHGSILRQILRFGLESSITP